MNLRLRAKIIWKGKKFQKQHFSVFAGHSWLWEDGFQEIFKDGKKTCTF